MTSFFHFIKNEHDLYFVNPREKKKRWAKDYRQAMAFDTRTEALTYIGNHNQLKTKHFLDHITSVVQKPLSYPNP